jgi:hypothetical protein
MCLGVGDRIVWAGFGRALAFACTTGRDTGEPENHHHSCLHPPALLTRRSPTSRLDHAHAPRGRPSLRCQRVRASQTWRSYPNQSGRSLLRLIECVRM